MTLANQIRRLQADRKYRLGYATGYIDANTAQKSYSSTEVLDILLAINETPGAGAPRESNS